MSAEYDKLVATRRFLQREKTIDEIKEIARLAFGDIQTGVKLTNVSFEGGSGSGQVSCEPHILLNACEDALTALGEPTAVAQPAVVFQQFSGNILQT